MAGARYPWGQRLSRSLALPHDSLHGLSRALILLVASASVGLKCSFTREHSHAVSLLIMDCF